MEANRFIRAGAPGRATQGFFRRRLHFFPVDCTLSPSGGGTPAGDLGFSLSEDGDPVGRIGIEIREQEAETTIRTEIDIRVTVLFVIPVLVYRHSSVEVWVDGAFRRFSGLTVDNGREFAVTVSAQGNGLRVTVNGAAEDWAGSLLSWLLWCEEALKDGPLLNPLKGRRSEMTVAYRGLWNRWRTGTARRGATT